MANSQRHHYIPRFLIKGFVGEDNKVAVYNKEKQLLEKSRKSPNQVFFEWNRNTFNIEGELTDFVEELFQFGESQFAPLYKKIIEQPKQIKIDISELLHLILFIAEIHWRVPARDSLVDDLLSRSTNKDLLFSIYNTKTGEEAPQELYNKFINEPAFKETSKMLLAIINYLKTDWETKLNNWVIYYPAEGPQLHLLGDNPVILRNPNVLNIYDSELIFPLSKGKIVYHTKGNIIKPLPPEHRFFVDVLIFLQSNKMVCGPSKDYLKAIVGASKLYRTEDDFIELKEKIFKVFEQS